MNKKVKIIARLSVAMFITLAFISCQEETVTSERVRLVLDSLEHKLNWLDYRLVRERWSQTVAGKADSLAFYENLSSYLLSDMTTFNVLTRGENLLRGDEDTRRLELMRSRFLVNIVESQGTIEKLCDSLNEQVESNEPEFMGNRKTVSEILEVLDNNKNRTNREMAYRVLYEVDQSMENRLERLIRLRNQEARKTGYNDYLAMLFGREEFKKGETESLLKKLDSLTANSYLTILEKIRGSLSVAETEIWDIPYYFSNVFNEFDRYFPADSQLEYIENGLTELGFTLNKMPVYFNFITVPEGPTDIHSFIIKSPYDQRVAGKIGNGFEGNKTLVKNIGRALYAANIAQEQPIFNYPLEDSWTAAMESIFASIVGDTAWLKKYVPIPAGLIEHYLVARQERRLVTLRLSLVNLEFELEAYKNPRRDLNKVYWDIFEKYTSLPRHDDLKPWATDLYFVNQPLTYQNLLLADIIAAQTLAYLEKNNGTVVANPETRSFLVQNYFRFGSRYRWRELIQRGTGEAMNPQYLLSDLGL
ncbi:MAG: hypothetical protein JXA92_00600 [candidate division Zixibacteria bacterium]|nr:hypothetical protein [candidate division Zixibacteria bacterium]